MVRPAFPPFYYYLVAQLFDAPVRCSDPRLHASFFQNYYQLNLFSIRASFHPLAPTFGLVGFLF